MSINQSTGNSKRQALDWIISFLALTALIAGMILAYIGSHSPLSWLAYPGWGLIALAFLVSLNYYARRSRAVIWGLGLAAIILLTLITPSPYNPPQPKQPYAFALDASKIKSDLDILANSHEKVIVVLIVNKQNYSYQAQIIQMALTGSPIACQFASPAPIPSATTTPAAVPTVSGTPCLNGVVGNVSVELLNADPSVREDFMSELPNASTIYIFPASSQNEQSFSRKA